MECARNNALFIVLTLPKVYSKQCAFLEKYFCFVWNNSYRRMHVRYYVRIGQFIAQCNELKVSNFEDVSFFTWNENYFPHLNWHQNRGNDIMSDDSSTNSVCSAIVILGNLHHQIAFCISFYWLFFHLNRYCSEKKVELKLNNSPKINWIPWVCSEKIYDRISTKWKKKLNEYWQNHDKNAQFNSEMTRSTAKLAEKWRIWIKLYDKRRDSSKIKWELSYSEPMITTNHEKLKENFAAEETKARHFQRKCLNNWRTQ